MGIPRFDTGLRYDAASAPDERRLSGPGLETPPTDWTTPGVTSTPWSPGRREGTGDTITKDTPVAGTATLDDAGGAFVAGHVGSHIEFQDVTDDANRGSFLITAVNSATQLEYKNPNAVTATEAFAYMITHATGLEGNPVDEWKDANGYDGGAGTGTKVSSTGSFTITQDTPVAGTATLDDAGGAFLANMVGTFITISGATAPDNNGLFQITAVNSSTQLEYKNANAVTVTESFTYGVSQADLGYGSDANPTKSWRFDVDLPSGWYTFVTRAREGSEHQ